jgi:hypothetical protein
MQIHLCRLYGYFYEHDVLGIRWSLNRDSFILWESSRT